MKVGIKNRWLKALRSDEYVQGAGKLMRPAGDYDEFCCLGVLCDVLGEEFEETPWGSLGVAINGGGVNVGGLPDRLLEQVSMSNSQQATLIRMNDVKGSSFEEIADWIESNL